MDQEKIGKFILEMRKQKGLTQKELAERIGISDKTISKWECGNSMPDISYLESLCNSLDISVNELLSGECLSDESYSEKAEENIMALMKENETNKKSGFLQVIVGIAIACVGFFILFFGSSGTMVIFQHLIDGITFWVMGLLCVASVVLAGKRTKQDVLAFLQKIVIPNGVLVSMIELMALLTRLDDVSLIGSRVAVCVLAILYAVVAYWIITIIRARGEDA